MKEQYVYDSVVSRDLYISSMPPTAVGASRTLADHRHAPPDRRAISLSRDGDSSFVARAQVRGLVEVL